MKIGQALRTERLNLGLTQSQMCEGILSRPFYAKVESCKNGINAESLFQILIAHQVDIAEFYGLVKETYMSSENKLFEQFQIKMDHAVNTKNIKKIKEYCQDIVDSSEDEILKLRAVTTVAYFENNLNKIDPKIKLKIKKEFDEGKNWINRPESLRLFANTMPLWPQDELDFFIKRLLASVTDNEISELMLERYLRIFGNYLVICYMRKIYDEYFIKKVMDYVIRVTSKYHLMIYRIHVLYLQALFEGNKNKAKKIREDMKEFGYDTVIANWPL